MVTVTNDISNSATYTEEGYISFTDSVGVVTRIPNAATGTVDLAVGAYEVSVTHKRARNLSLGRILVEANDTRTLAQMLAAGGLGIDRRLVANVVISSAEILALNATPKQLVAAPGANKVLLLDRAIFFLDYNAAAYAGIAAGEDWNIKYENASGLAVGFLETTGFLDLTADAYRVMEVGASAGTILNNYTPLVNKALVLHQLSGEIITGDSPVAVRVFYTQVDLSTLLTA